MTRLALLGVLATLITFAPALSPLRSASSRSCPDALMKADACCDGEPRLLPKAIAEQCRSADTGMSDSGMNRGDPTSSRDGSMRGDNSGRMDNNNPVRGGMSVNNGDSSSRMDNSGRNSGPIMKRPNKGSKRGNDPGTKKEVVLKVPFRSNFKSINVYRKNGDPNDGTDQTIGKKRGGFDENNKMSGVDGGVRPISANNDGGIRPVISGMRPMGTNDGGMRSNSANDDAMRGAFAAVDGGNRPTGSNDGGMSGMNGMGGGKGQRMDQKHGPCVMECAFKKLGYISSSGVLDPDAVTNGFIDELNLLNNVAWKPLVMSGVESCVNALKDVDMSKAPPQQGRTKCGWAAKFFMVCMRQHLVGNCPQNFTDSKEMGCTDKFWGVRACNPFEFPPAAQMTQYLGRKPQEDGGPLPSQQEDPQNAKNEDDKEPPGDPNQKGGSMGKRLNIYTNRPRQNPKEQQGDVNKEEDYPAPPTDSNQKGGTMEKRLNIYTNRDNKRNKNGGNNDEGDYPAPPTDSNGKAVTMPKRLNIFTSLRGKKKPGDSTSDMGGGVTPPSGQDSGEEEE